MQIVDWVFGHALDASDERMVAGHAIPRTCWCEWMSDLIQEQGVQKALLSCCCPCCLRKLKRERESNAPGIWQGQRHEGPAGGPEWARIVRIKYISLLNNVFKLQMGAYNGISVR
jgi:hypothetical protein